MQDWNLTKLKAHLQWTLGKIDSLRWVVGRISLTGDNLTDVKDRIRDLEIVEKDCSRYIQAILDERAAKKQAEVDRRQEVHQSFKGF